MTSTGFKSYSTDEFSGVSSLQAIGEVDNGQLDQRYGPLSFSNRTSTGKRKKKRATVTACTSLSKYELVRRCIEDVGMVNVQDEDVNSSANLIWCDSVVQAERVQELKNYQHINHFPGMAEICRKDFLARNMAKMSRARPEEYNFTPRTWILPSEYNLLVLHWKDMKKKNRKPATFIMKPANGAMGNGIHLFRNPERLIPQDHMIVQEYLDRPFLLDGYKIDLRLYVLVTHCDPLRAFLYQDGLVRLSTEKYCSPSESNVDSLYMHLTNYSVNKFNEKFQRHADMDRGSKRSIKSLMDYLRTSGYNTNTLWRSIIDLIVKTLIVVGPHILHCYRMSRPGNQPHADSVCFEVLGFDVFLDRKLKPWLLEVNRSPSFGTDERVDHDVKSGVIKDALKMLNIQSSDKSRKLAQQKADAQRRLLRPSDKRLYASSNITNADKRKLILNRRKEELKERLLWARKDSTREEYENNNMNNYIRIFPSAEKIQQERYLNLVQESFNLFLRSRSAPFQKNIIDHYMLQREDEILDLLEQCEVEEMGSNVKSHRHIQPLSSMPILSPSSSRRNRSTSSSSSSSSSEDEELQLKRKSGNITSRAVSKLSPEAVKATRMVRHGSGRERDSASVIHSDKTKRSFSISPLRSRPLTGKSGSNNSQSKKQLDAPLRATIPRYNKKTKSSADERDIAVVQAYINAYTHTSSNIPGTITHKPGRTYKRMTDLEELRLVTTQEREEEINNRTLAALKNARIKFPGKSDSEAENILNKIMDNWKYHKPRVATYWLVKLDSTKRKKVIDIVQGNVRAVVERTWMVSGIDSLKLMRTFNRVFNRMNSSHGQGLWSCFSTSGNSWETIFSKSSDTLSNSELECCRRIVQLCKDCLLIVYQFANDAQQYTTNFTPPSTNYSSDASSFLTLNNMNHRNQIYRLPSRVQKNNNGHHARISTDSDGKNSFSKTSYLMNEIDENTKGSIAGTVPLDNLPKRFTRSLQIPTSIF